MADYKHVLVIPVLVILILGTVLLCGCTQSSAPGEKLGTENQAETGKTLSVTGSTTVLPVAAQAADAYMDIHPDVDIQVNGGGSGVGVQSAGEGTAMIGMISRDLKAEEKEKYPDLTEHQIATDGIAIIVNKDNTVPSLTLEQVKAIYSGNVTNWKDVGGQDAAIVVVGRDSASGTREYFHESVMKKEDFVQTQLEKNSNGAVKQTVEQTSDAIGYVGLGYIDDTIRAVPINVNGNLVTPTIEHVLAGTYPVSRPLHLVTKGEPEGSAAAFIAFITSPDGQKIVSEEGFVPLQ
jgi:phosphate transport system substrate-binding protein